MFKNVKLSRLGGFFLVFAFVLGVASEDLLAQRRGGGGFRSTRSFSSPKRSGGGSSLSGGSKNKLSDSKSSSQGVKKASDGWGSGTKYTTPGASSLSGNRASARKVNDADRALAAKAQKYDAAAKSGKAFGTRDEAVNKFKQQEGARYTNKFDREPSTRPDYIPRNTNVGGTNYNVTYNQGFGGYGYYGPGGSWVMYDMWRDMMMIDMMMNHHGYHHGAPPAARPVIVKTDSGEVVYVEQAKEDDSSGLLFGLIVIGVIAVIFIAVKLSID